MEKINVCPACEKKSFTKKFLCKDYTVSHETFQIVQCDFCGLGITTPRPAQENIGAYYLSENYISHTRKAQTIVDKIYLFARRFTLKRKLNLINTLRDKPGHILDYGCGTGEFLLTCKNAKWFINGVEPSAEARIKAQQILSTEIENSIENFQTKFDVITLWHVLEHVPDPLSTLQQLSDKLNPNGTIVVAVPNYNSHDGSHYKEYWAGFDVPRHLWHFNTKSMDLLLKKKTLKLESIKPMKLDSFYVSLLSEKYKRDKQTIPSMVHAFLIGLLSNIKAKRNGNYSSLIYIIKK